MNLIEALNDHAPPRYVISHGKLVDRTKMEARARTCEWPAATTRICTVAERAAAQRRSYSSPSTGRLHNNFQSECSAMNNWHSTLANFALALRAEFAALDFEQVCMAVT